MQPFQLQGNVSSTATLGTGESGCCGEVAVSAEGGGRGGVGGGGREYNPFIVYCAKYMLTVFHNGNNPIITEIIGRDKIQKMA